MDFSEVLRKRRMCRAFSEEPVPEEVLDRLLDSARRAPSAGFSQGVAFLVLTSPSERSQFWSLVATEDWLESPTVPGLLRAPCIVVPLSSSSVYTSRYSEPDKAAFGLGEEGAWPVPYWTVDAAFATMVLLLGAVDAGLGALFFGRDAAAYSRLLPAFGVPPSWSAIGFVLLGRPSPGLGFGPAGSAAVRARRPLSEVVHRGAW